MNTNFYTMTFHAEERDELLEIFKGNLKWEQRIEVSEKLKGNSSNKIFEAVEEYDNPKFNPIPKPVFPPNQLLSEGAFKMTTKDAPKSS